MCVCLFVCVCVLKTVSEKKNLVDNKNTIHIFPYLPQLRVIKKDIPGMNQSIHKLLLYWKSRMGARVVWW